MNCIKNNRGAGVHGMITSMFMLMLIIVVTIATFRVIMIKGSYKDIESRMLTGVNDAAVEMIDYKSIEAIETVNMSDTDIKKAAFNFKKNYAENLSLETSLSDNEYLLSDQIGTVTDDEILCNQVRLLNYTLYSVNAEKTYVTKKTLTSGGSVSTDTLPYGSVRTPDGILVENSLIYTEVEFEVKGYFGATGKKTVSASHVVYRNADEYGVMFDGPTSALREDVLDE